MYGTSNKSGSGNNNNVFCFVWGLADTLTGWSGINGLFPALFCLWVGWASLCLVVVRGETKTYVLRFLFDRGEAGQYNAIFFLHSRDSASASVCVCVCVWCGVGFGGRGIIILMGKTIINNEAHSSHFVFALLPMVLFDPRGHTQAPTPPPFVCGFNFGFWFPCEKRDQVQQQSH